MLGREAIESLKIVAILDDSKKAAVNLVSSSVRHPYYSKSLSPVVTEPPGGRRFESMFQSAV